MAGEPNAAYREPCGGWPAANLPMLGDCDGCLESGWKAVQAQKNWHGCAGFEDCPATECDYTTTKYRTWRADGWYKLLTTYESPPGSGNCVTDYGEQVDFSVQVTVNKDSGLVTVSDCDMDAYSIPIFAEHYVVGCITEKDTEWNADSEPDPTGCSGLTQSLTHSNTTYTHEVLDIGIGTDYAGQYSITCTLSDPYTLAACHGDAKALLALWDLADDVEYPWETGAFGSVHYIHRNENGAQSPINVISLVDPCNWTDAGGYTNEIIGGPGDVHYLAAQTEGAFLHCTVATVYLQKYAAVMPITASYDHFRPCGADRDDARFPDAWPICGRCAVATATQNGANVDLVLTDAAPYLETGDYIDTDGLPGIGDNLAVTVTDSTHCSVVGTLSEAYTSGGYIWSHGAPNYWWHDTQSKGDYVYATWEYDPCTLVGDFDCSQQCLYPGPACAPATVCITPNGEVFPNGDTFDFPAAALAKCWQALPVWTMDDPLWDEVGDPDQVEARCALPTWNGETAPAIPGGEQYGPTTNGANWLPAGGCIDLEWV